MILKQYKIYVEMVDKTSQRRSVVSSTFCLTLALCVECAFWFIQALSYKILNSKKYRVINSLEARLPARPWEAEWPLSALEVEPGGTGA